MKTIFKYELPVEGGPKDIMLPRGAQVLSFDHQGDPSSVCMWALVNPDEPTKMAKTFYVVGTGHELPEPSKWTYMATVNYHPVPLVWHIFTENLDG